MLSGLISAFIVAGSLLPTIAALPSTNNYKLNSYSFGSGGTSNSSTGNYSLEGITGELSGQTAATSTYNQKPGYTETQQANVPKVTLTNPSNYYDKLHFVIDQQDNPSDALYAMQVSTTSDFSSGITYVQADNTLGATLTTADYQTYTTWGGAAGGNIVGLNASTTYYIRAKATQGQFTESAYGPSSNAATVGQQISFCLYTSDGGSGNCSSSTHTTSFSGLVAGSVSSASNSLDLTFSTNADSGGNVYIYSTGKLQSTTVPSGTINSVTVTGGTPVDLTSLSSGYGAQVSSASGISVLPQYNGSGNNVGELSTIINTLLSAASPVTSGTATIQLQAKASNTTPATTDYADIVTVIAAASF